ncbi:hypothetical protein [Nocardia carnea]|uniref:hypothetical protein n=1 Tax=Nocardia carnea TaxID=37328 RepID=UPI0024569F4E|nr:hypothetical protein [Nocardia carnea]
MHDPVSSATGFIPSQADRHAPVAGAGQLPRFLRGGRRDATPLLTGLPRAAARPGTLPAPQRRPLAARYRSADPIDVDGAVVYPMYSEQLPAPATALTITLLSATPPAGLAGVGIGLSVLDGCIELDHRQLTGVDIWRDALERGITFDLVAHAPGALFALTPVWSNSAGEPQSWSGNYGIVVEHTETGRTVLWCSMGEGPPHFTDLVIEIRSTPLDPHPQLFTPGAVPVVSTAGERPGNRHRRPDSGAALPGETDPWAAHYEPAVDDPGTALPVVEFRTAGVRGDAGTVPAVPDFATPPATGFESIPLVADRNSIDATPTRGPVSAEDDGDDQGIPCSFADIDLSAPAPAGAPDAAIVTGPAAASAAIDDFTGYDDPLTGTAVLSRIQDNESRDTATGNGWAASPELTGLVPVIRDAGITDYGAEPPRRRAAPPEHPAHPSPIPLLSGQQNPAGPGPRDDQALVDTLADNSLAPIPAGDPSPAAADIDLDRLHCLGAVAHAQGDDDRAHLLWTRAARAGHLGAIYDLGALSLHHDDPEAAEHWWRIAAGRRLISAMADLAALLEDRGAVAEARMWRTQAVAEEVIATAARPSPAESLTGTQR